MKTITNCRVIKEALWLGEGYPEINNGKCHGYCTEDSDEPCEQCKRCKLRIMEE